MPEKHVLANGHAPELGSPAVRCGDLVFVSGQPGATPTAAAAAVRALCEQAGGSLADVLELIVLTRDAAAIEPALGDLRTVFGELPAVLAGSSASGPPVQIQATARLGGERIRIAGPAGSWLAAVGIPAACRNGELVFVSGQLALDGAGRVLAAGDHCGQARIAYRGMLDAVAAAGGSVADVVDFTSFHDDIRGADATLQEVYGPEVLGAVGPDSLAATSHIGLPGLVRPGLLGTYRAIADLSPGERVSVTPDSIWWKGVLPVAGGSRKTGGNLIAIAGQVACGPDGEVVARGDFAGQARYLLDSMREVLAGFGASVDGVVSVLSFHHDLRSWPAVREVAQEVFGGRSRAWTTIGASALWMEGYLHEISALAIV